MVGATVSRILGKYAILRVRNSSVALQVRENADDAMQVTASKEFEAACSRPSRQKLLQIDPDENELETVGVHDVVLGFFLSRVPNSSGQLAIEGFVSELEAWRRGRERNYHVVERVHV